MRFDLRDYPFHQAPVLRCRGLTVEEIEHNFSLTTDLQNQTAPLSNSAASAATEAERKAGNIGIGTTASATEKLEVNGNVKVSGRLGIGTTSPAMEKLEVNGNAKVSGNFGIGTTSPATEKLEVNGNIKVTGNVTASGTLTASSGMTMPLNKGLIVKYVTSNTVDIDADYLTVYNSSNLGVVLSGVDLTVNIGSSGANGLDTSTEVASTTYYIWVIWNGTTTAGLLSTSYTSPTLPSDYTFKRLVGSVRNDSSLDFLNFHQIGNEVMTTEITVASGIGASGSTSLSGIIPNYTLVKMVHYGHIITSFSYPGTTTLWSNSSFTLGKMVVHSQASGNPINSVSIPTIDGSVHYALAGGAGPVDIRCTGWSLNIFD